MLSDRWRAEGGRMERRWSPSVHNLVTLSTHSVCTCDKEVRETELKMSG